MNLVTVSELVLYVGGRKGRTIVRIPDDHMKLLLREDNSDEWKIERHRLLRDLGSKIGHEASKLASDLLADPPARGRVNSRFNLPAKKRQ